MNPKVLVRLRSPFPRTIPSEVEGLVWVGSIFFITIFILFFSNGCFSSETKTPADPYLWDFGKVKQGSILEHIFELKNESEATLIIKEVRPSCGCTASVVSVYEIPPGEISKIGVKFNTKSYSGDVKQFIYVHTNNPIEPIIKFTVKATVIKE